MLIYELPIVLYLLQLKTGLLNYSCLLATEILCNGLDTVVDMM